MRSSALVFDFTHNGVSRVAKAGTGMPIKKAGSSTDAGAPDASIVSSPDAVPG